MPIVLIDAPGVELALVGPVEPRAVQIVLSGLTAGQQVTVTGTAGAFTWTVRGGHAAIVTGDTLRLTDVATPINIPITYAIDVDGVVSTVGPVTVPCAAPYVLQSEDGRTAVAFEYHGHEDERELLQRVTALQVPGRRAPVARWDVAGGESGSWLIRTTPAGTAALLEHLRATGPAMVLRTDGTIYDQQAVEHLLITAAQRSRFAFDGERMWSLRFVVIDDPEPELVIPVSTGDDFDAAWAGLTWMDFDLEMAGLTGDEFDAIDWTQYA